MTRTRTRRGVRKRGIQGLADELLEVALGLLSVSVVLLLVATGIAGAVWGWVVTLVHIPGF